jgi:hypothetical protein
MKRTLIALVFVALAAAAQVAYAASSDSHVVTVTVNELNGLAVTGGAVSMTLDTIDPATGAITSKTDSAAGLQYATNAAAARKVTVQTNITATHSTLTVEAISITKVSGSGSAGTSAGVVTLSAPGAHDFITGVSKAVATCTLKYTASSTIEKDPGVDAHTVTYTLTN